MPTFPRNTMIEENNPARWILGGYIVLRTTYTSPNGPMKGALGLS